MADGSTGEQQGYIQRSVAALRERTRDALSPWVRRRLAAQEEASEPPRAGLTVGGTRTLVARLQGAAERTKVWKPDLGSLTPVRAREFGTSVASRLRVERLVAVAPRSRPQPLDWGEELDLVLPAGSGDEPATTTRMPGMLTVGQRIEPLTTGPSFGRPASPRTKPTQARQPSRPRPRPLPPRARLYSRVEEVRPPMPSAGETMLPPMQAGPTERAEEDEAAAQEGIPPLPPEPPTGERKVSPPPPRPKAAAPPVQRKPVTGDVRPSRPVPPGPPRAPRPSPVKGRGEPPEKPESSGALVAEAGLETAREMVLPPVEAEPPDRAEERPSEPQPQPRVETPPPARPERPRVSLPPLPPSPTTPPEERATELPLKPPVRPRPPAPTGQPAAERESRPVPPPARPSEPERSPRPTEQPPPVQRKAAPEEERRPAVLPEPPVVAEETARETAEKAEEAQEVVALPPQPPREAEELVLRPPARRRVAPEGRVSRHPLPQPPTTRPSGPRPGGEGPTDESLTEGEPSPGTLGRDVLRRGEERARAPVSRPVRRTPVTHRAAAMRVATVRREPPTVVRRAPMPEEEPLRTPGRPVFALLPPSPTVLPPSAGRERAAEVPPAVLSRLRMEDVRSGEMPLAPPPAPPQPPGGKPPSPASFEFTIED